VTGNFTAVGDRVAAAGDPAGAAGPVPRISGQPETVSAAPPWTAPQPGGGGRITVARDVLRSVAGRMRSELATLDSAVSRVRAAGAGVGSLQGWPTGDAFSGNAINAHIGCLSASEQVGDGHQAFAGNLSDSAATYDAAESDSTQAVHGVAAVLDGSPAASSAAAGNAFAGGTAATSSGRLAGAAPAAGPYPVKSNDVQPFDAAGMTAAQIMSILHRLDSGAVAEAGTAHTALGRTADTMAGHLTGYAQTLAQSWTGTAAQAAMARLQQLYDQTSVLAAQAAQTGSALTWLGTDVLPAFQRLQTPGTGSALATGAAAGGVIGGVIAGAGGAMAGTAGGAAAAGLDALLTGAGAAAQAQAQKYLSALSGYLVTANSSLPGEIGGPAVLASATRGGPGTNGTDEAAAATGTANGPVTGRSGPVGPVTSRTAAGSGGLVLGGAGGAGATLGTGRTGSAAGAGGAGSTPAAGGGGSAADAVAGSPSDAGGGGSALPAAATGPAPGADGSALSGGGAGAPVSGASRIASPAPPVNSLQSAVPVPGSTPGVAPASPPAAASASGTPGAGSLNAGGASSLPPVPMVPGLPGPGAGAVANGGGNVGDGSNQGRSGDGAAGTPAPAGLLPGVQGEAGAAGVPQVPGLDGGLTGGATLVPEGPGLVAPSAVPGAVPGAGATGSLVVTPDGTAVPGSGDSSGRGMLSGMPMAGGGTGQPEKERMRRAWGSEDENVWGLPSGCVPPVIEGG